MVMDYAAELAAAALREQREVWAEARGRFDALADAADKQWRLLASVGISLERTAHELSRMAAAQRAEYARLAAEVPIWHRAVRSPKYPASGDLAVSLGGPSTGRLWHVRQLTVGGLTLATTAAGTAEIYVGSVPLVAGGGAAGATAGTAISLGDLVDATILNTTELPNIAYYDDGQVLVRPGESLWVVIRGGTAGQQYVAGATVKDIAVDGPDSPDL